MWSEVLAGDLGEHARRDLWRAHRERLHHGDHAQTREAPPEVGRADGAVLHAMAHAASARGFDRVAHGFDGAVPDGMSGHLKPRIGGSLDQRVELFRRRPPQASARAHHHALGAAVDEHLDLMSVVVGPRDPGRPMVMLAVTFCCP